MQQQPTLQQHNMPEAATSAPTRSRSFLQRRGLQLVPSSHDEALRQRGKLYASYRATHETVTAYVGKPPELLLCPCCGDVFDDAVLLPCGHSHCRTCATLPALRDSALAGGMLPEATDATCTLCNVTWQHAETPADVARGRSAMEVLKVLCCHGLRLVATEEQTFGGKHRKIKVRGLGADGSDGSSFVALDPSGCRTIVPLSDKQEHEAACPFRPVVCGLRDDDSKQRREGDEVQGYDASGVRRHSVAHSCTARVRFKDLDAHRRTCEFRRVTCLRCGGSFNARRQAEHDAICEMTPCPLGCGALCRRGDGVSKHIEYDCPRALVYCGNIAERGEEADGTEVPPLAPWPRMGDAPGSEGIVRSCGFACRRCDLSMHQRNACPYRLRTCEHCGKGVSAVYLEAHVKRCPGVVIPCPNLCGMMLRRGELKQHLTTACSAGSTSCPYVELGCQARYARGEEEHHLKTNAHNHLAMVAHKVNSMQGTFDAMRESVWALSESVDNHAKASEERHRLLEAQLADVMNKQREDFSSVCADLSSMRDYFFERLEEEVRRWEARTSAESVGFQKSYRSFVEAHERIEGLAARLQTRAGVASNLESFLSDNDATNKANPTAGGARKSDQRASAQDVDGDDDLPDVRALQRELAAFQRREDQDHHAHRMKLVLLTERVDGLSKLVASLVTDQRGIAAAEAMMLNVPVPNTASQPPIVVEGISEPEEAEEVDVVEEEKAETTTAAAVAAKGKGGATSSARSASSASKKPGAAVPAAPPKKPAAAAKETAKKPAAKETTAKKPTAKETAKKPATAAASSSGKEKKPAAGKPKSSPEEDTLDAEAEPEETSAEISEGASRRFKGRRTIDDY